MAGRCKLFAALNNSNNEIMGSNPDGDVRALFVSVHLCVRRGFAMAVLKSKESCTIYINTIKKMQTARP